MPGDVRSTPALDVRNLSVAYADNVVVRDVSFALPTGSMTAIVGPNGAGKSTVLKAVLGVVPKLRGEIALFGTSLNEARDRVAYVPQRASVDWDFPVQALDVVLMGLYRRIGPFARITRARRREAQECLDRVGMADFAARQIGQLSGGQQQRVFLARALAQSADLLLLDEPLAGVDAATERTVIDVLRGLNADGVTVAAVHHDLSTVSDYFGRVVLLDGTLVAAGTVAEAFTDDTLARAYGGRLVVRPSKP